MAYTQVQLEGMIADAKSAYHDLLLGRAARVVIDRNGERVEFVSANRQNLYLYILDLEKQLAMLLADATVPRNGPLGFTF